jgi:hypothetical protein
LRGRFDFVWVVKARREWEAVELVRSLVSQASLFDKLRAGTRAPDRMLRLGEAPEGQMQVPRLR